MQFVAAEIGNIILYRSLANREHSPQQPPTPPRVLCNAQKGLWRGWGESTTSGLSPPRVLLRLAPVWCIERQTGATLRRNRRRTTDD